MIIRNKNQKEIKKWFIDSRKEKGEITSEKHESKCMMISDSRIVLGFWKNGDVAVIEVSEMMGITDKKVFEAHKDQVKQVTSHIKQLEEK